MLWKFIREGATKLFAYIYFPFSNEYHKFFQLIQVTCFNFCLAILLLNTHNDKQLSLAECQPCAGHFPRSISNDISVAEDSATIRR